MLSHGRFDDQSTVQIAGREYETELLRRLFARAKAGHGGLVLVSGEAGIGKTTLTHVLSEDPICEDAIILWGYCYDLSTTPPYGLWLELTDRYRPTGNMPELPTVLRRGTGVGELPSQIALFEVTEEFLRGVAEAGPTLVILEDLHWADQASLDLLRYVARYLTDVPVMMIATYRDDELTREQPLYPLIPQLVRESGADRIELGTLGADDVGELVSSRWSLNPGDHRRLVEHLMIYADGNPFFTVELLRILEQNGFLTRNGGLWKLGDITSVQVPSLVQQVIEDRLTRLGDEARHFLEVAAVIGQEVELDTWQQVAGVTDDELANVLEEAMRSALIEDAGDGRRVRFVHALTREALYRSNLPPRRRIWHRVIAEKLAEAPVPVSDAVAFHFQQANDPRAVEWLIRAGEWAQRTFAWRNAVDRFRAASDALRHEESRVRERGWLLYRIGRLSLYLDAERGVSDLEEAIRIAIRTSDRVLHAASLVRRGHLLTFTGDIQRGIDEMGRGVAAWDDISLEEKQACEFFDVVGSDLHINIFQGTWLLQVSAVGRFQECLDVAETFLLEIEAARDRLLAERQIYWLDGYVGISEAHALLGNVQEASEILEKARTGFAAIGIPIMESFCSHLRLRYLHMPYEADRLEERRRIVAEMDEAWNRSSGSIKPEMTSRLQHVGVLALTGYWEEVLDLAERGLDWHANKLRQGELRAEAGRVARNRGDLQLAWEHVYHVLQDITATPPGAAQAGFPDVTELIRVAAELELDAGNLDEAEKWLDLYDQWMHWSGAIQGLAEGNLLRARLALLNDEPEVAREHAEAALALASEPRQPLALIETRRMLGELAIRDGDYDEAERQLQNSRELAINCDAPHERALTELAMAELEVAKGNRAEASKLISSVEQIGQELGAQPLLERATALSRRLGRPERHSTSGLTSRELEVLWYLVDGKADKAIADELFISPHTVMRHVSSILRKLDVESRTAAASRAVRDEIV